MHDPCAVPALGLCKAKPSLSDFQKECLFLAFGPCFLCVPLSLSSFISAFLYAESNPARVHFAISAPSAEAVKAYHEAAISAGGKDNGAPGPRDHYASGVIGAFVIDLDDNNIEVCNSQ